MNKFNLDSIAYTAGTITERREAIEREKAARTVERQRLLSSLTSPRHESKDRIRLWERFFGIHLPREPDHKLLHIIAKQTALQVSDIQFEQARRRAEAAPLPAVTTEP